MYIKSNKLFLKSVGFESKFVACENPVIVHTY